MILDYLRYTWEYGVHYTGYPKVIKGYYDAHCISDINDSKQVGICSNLEGQLYAGRHQNNIL